MAQVEEKLIAANAALDLIENGMTVGLGSGTTAAMFLRLLGERVRSGLKIKGVPTSESTAQLARELGILLVSLDDQPHPDIDIDGADEATESMCLIKGGGGALLREKIVAFASRRFVAIIDSSKLVKKLGKFPLPVEIVPFARSLVADAVVDLGGKPVLRQANDGTAFLTDQGNWILDCSFGAIEDPSSLASKLADIPGIVEHGLFIGLADQIIVGRNGSAV